MIPIAASEASQYQATSSMSNQHSSKEKQYTCSDDKHRHEIKANALFRESQNEPGIEEDTWRSRRRLTLQ